MARVKVHGPSSAVRKEFDSALRTFILSLQGDSSRTKIEYPKNATKQSLHLTQRYLVFQLFLHSSSFALEVAVLTRSNLKLRFILSTSCREISIASHHVKMPCSMVETHCWVNLTLDLSDLVANYSPEGNDSFAHVDSVLVSADCKLKRIFSMKERPVYVTDFPRTVSFPVTVENAIQVKDPLKVSILKGNIATKNYSP